MFEKVFATVFFLTIPTAYAFQDSRPQLGTDAPVEVGVLFQSSSLRIRNFAEVNQVLIFESSGLKLYRLLPVGGEFDWSFTPHALDGVNLEVASAKGGGWRYTGALSLTDYAVSGSDTLWIQPFVPQSLSWLQSVSGLALFPHGASYLPAYFQDCVAGTTGDIVPDASAVHVPVITPSNTPQGDGPPHLEKQPIPPM
jgi:hypothetical protein